jgi:hypothetical protein
MRRRIAALGVVSALSVPLTACGGSDACTLLECDNVAIVTFPGGLVSGPYDLVVEDLGDSIVARCSDLGSPEAMENPPEIECDVGGFTLVGHDLANARSFRVSIIDVASDEVLVEGAEVFLTVAHTDQPNGPDCPPTCYERHGQVIDTEPR